MEYSQPIETNFPNRRIDNERSSHLQRFRRPGIRNWIHRNLVRKARHLEDASIGCQRESIQSGQDVPRKNP
ncbi:hypothetical protein WP1_108 [Pseudomonas phage WP1]